jgi:hypothetical protein
MAVMSPGVTVMLISGGRGALHECQRHSPGPTPSQLSDARSLIARTWHRNCRCVMRRGGKGMSHKHRRLYVHEPNRMERPLSGRPLRNAGEKARRRQPGGTFNPNDRGAARG